MRRIIAFLCAAQLSVFAVACTSSTVIRSQPTGAHVFLNGEYVGQTPYVMSDTKIVGSSTQVRLEYPGYAPVSTVISRNEEFDVGACVGGVFLLVPFFWIEGYKPTHDYWMRPGSPIPPPGQVAPPTGAPPPAPAPAPPGQMPPNS